MCELCGRTNNLSLYQINKTMSLMVCETCKNQIENPKTLDPNHWRFLQESMWSESTAVQVISYRMLTTLKPEPWARDLLEQMYLDEATLEIAQAGISEEDEIDSSTPTLDSNGSRLMEGDSVTLVKDLEVKGGGFTAKRGTLVKNISLTNNPKHIEGRVNGIQIVLVSAYLKKA